MSDEPEPCAALARANLSRQRAWTEMQKIRAVLALTTKLPPPPNPRDFVLEGETLRLALARALGDWMQLVVDLEAAIEAIRPFLTGTGARPEGVGFTRALMDLNRLAHKGWPSQDVIRRLREVK